MRFKSTYMVGIWFLKEQIVFQYYRILSKNFVSFKDINLTPSKLKLIFDFDKILMILNFYGKFEWHLFRFWIKSQLNSCMYIIWLFSNFRCWSTRPIFHSWIFRGGWAFFRLCGFRKSVGGQLGAHEKSRLWNNEVVQPHNRGQGSRLEGTIKEVWRFDATFVFMAL